MTKTGLSGWRAALTFCPVQGSVKAEGHHLVAEPCRPICVRSAGGCLAGSIIKPMVESMGLSWQQGPLSTGAIGRFLVPNRCPRARSEPAKMARAIPRGFAASAIEITSGAFARGGCIQTAGNPSCRQGVDQ